MDVQRLLQMRAKQINAALHRYLPSVRTAPTTLHKAMRYSMFVGGKRLRPTLCLEAAVALGADEQQVIPLACSLEMIHTYSLIHDDLPAMDNDDFRRGHPTCHKVFGEAVAILAGDALLTLAFETLAKAQPTPRYDHGTFLLELSCAAGSRNLIAGQVEDLQNEGKPIQPRHLQRIHQRKTGALITTSLRLGAMAGNATPRQLQLITDFGKALGLAFQIVDDILDCEQTTEKLGKSAGKDAAAHKATYPALLGIAGAKQAAARWTQKAIESLKPLGNKASRLLAIANYLLHRDR